MKQRVTGRGSFTIVEILIVLAIVSILLAIAVGAYFRTERVAQQKAVESFIGMVDSAYKKAHDKVAKNCLANADPKNPSLPPTLDPRVSNELLRIGGSVQRAKVIYLKLTMRVEFPMNFWEVLNAPYPLSPKSSYVDKLTKAGITTVDPHAPVGAWESSCCLAMALEESRGGISVDLSTLGPNAVKDCPAYPGLRAIVDPYGQPVFFYRWAGMFGDFVPTNINGKNDPEDPDGLLSDANWVKAGGGQWMGDNCHWVDAGQSLVQNHLIVSAGRDGYLGLAPGTDADQAQGTSGLFAAEGAPNPISGPPGGAYTYDPPHEADNVYSNRVK